MDIHYVWMKLQQSSLGQIVCHFYRPQTKFAKVMFLHVSVCPQGVGVSRPWPRPKVEVEGSDLGGCLGPHPGGGWGVWPGGSRPTPRGRLGGLAGGCVSRPTPRGVCIPVCTEADPPSRRLLLWAVPILLECILVNRCFLYCNTQNVTKLPVKKWGVAFKRKEWP